MNKKQIAILGSTGSIGTQALEVVQTHPESFRVAALTAGNNVDLLISQALAFRPDLAVIGDEGKYAALRDALQGSGIRVAAGKEGLIEAATLPEVHTVLTALVGFAGLPPTLAALQAGKHIALANKETLVVAGELVMALAKQQGVEIYPVDSEHSAIFQCLPGEAGNPIEKIILTASGGPFRGRTREQLADVTKAQALKHPNWSMGAKITIDSASLMNKGLEVIEARWLFDLAPEQIEVVVHPQSIIHSMVQFADGSIKAQMGLPDMKLPIQYALSYPKRLPSPFERFDFARYPQLTFEMPDRDTFRNLQLAFDVLHRGGNMPCALNAANEVAVERFLKDEIKFLDIARINETVLQNTPLVEKPTLDSYFLTDQQAREMAKSI